MFTLIRAEEIFIDRNEIEDESMEMNIYHKTVNRFGEPVSI